MDDLLDQLDELRALLSTLSDRLDTSGVERTVGLRDSLGKDCVFYIKSGQLFIKRDYKDLRDLIQSCEEQFRILEDTNVYKTKQ